MEYEIYKGNDELYHWGIKGMRWGIRRYQNKDGSLTPAGKKRLKAESDAIKKEEEILKNRKATQAKFDRLDAKRKSLEEQKKALNSDDDKSKKPDTEETKPAKKSVKDMSDIELANEIRRVQMEKQYEALTAQPETVKKGNTFVKDFMEKAAVPALQEAGKVLIKDSLLKAGKKYLGLNTENTDDAVEKMAKEVKRMTTIKTYNKLKEEFAAESAKSKEKTDNKDAGKKSDTKSDTKTKDDDVETADKSETSNKKTDSSKTKDKVYEGTVEGVGTSSSKYADQGKEWTNDSKIIDVDWYEVVNDNTTSSGQSYVSNLLNSGSSVLALPAPRDDD